jgi:predicted  nucleic acid-binding Zn-ribbon protein
MVRIPDLYALQELDAELDAAERTLADLRARQIEDESVQPAQERIDGLTVALRSAAQVQRSADDDAEDGKAKVTGVEEKLYGGSVTVARELKDLQKDLESLQRSQAAREETALDALTAVGSLHTELESSVHELERRRDEWQAEQAQIATDAETLDEKVAALRERRRTADAPIDAQTLALYERLRKMRGGRAVARVERGACLGCRISLPSHIFQRARSGMAVIQCTSCERILYVG